MKAKLEKKGLQIPSNNFCQRGEACKDGTGPSPQEAEVKGERGRHHLPELKPHQSIKECL